MRHVNAGSQGPGFALPFAVALILMAGLSPALAGPSHRSKQPAAGPFLTDSRLTEPGATGGEEFGYAVAGSKSTLIVGSWQGDLSGQDSGAAYAWRWAGTAWTLEASLTGADVQSGWLCGRSVAIDGDTAVVGCFADYTKGSNTGSAYVFTRSSGSWTEQAKLVAPDADAFDNFGWSVAVSGDTIVVGAYNEGGTNYVQGHGAAYIFERAGGNWTAITKLTGSTTSPQGQFGWAVAAGGNGTRILVTDPLEGIFVGIVPFFYGAGYVYSRSNGEWALEARLSDISLGNGNEFESRGWSAAMQGDTVLLGAPDHTGTDFARTGRVYAYQRSGGTWSLAQTLELAIASFDERFGSAVALGRGLALVGTGNDDTAALDSGAVFVFARVGGDFQQSQQLLPSAPSGGERTGWSVAIAAGQVAGGAIYDSLAAPGAGTVVIWH